MSDTDIYEQHLKDQRANEARMGPPGGAGLPTGPCQCDTCKKVRAFLQKNATFCMSCGRREGHERWCNMNPHDMSEP